MAITIKYSVRIKTGAFASMALDAFSANYAELSGKSETLCQIFSDTDTIRPVFDIDSSHATEADMRVAAQHIAEVLVPEFVARHFPAGRANLLAAVGESKDPKKIQAGTPWKASFHLYIDRVRTTGRQLKALCALVGAEGLGAYLDASIYCSSKKMRSFGCSKPGEDRPLLPCADSSRDFRDYIIRNVEDGWELVQFQEPPRDARANPPKAAKEAKEAKEAKQAKAAPKNKPKPPAGKGKGEASPPAGANDNGGANADASTSGTADDGASTSGTADGDASTSGTAVSVAPPAKRLGRPPRSSLFEAPTAASPHSTDVIRGMVACLSPATAIDRQEWIRMGMGLQHEGICRGVRDLFFEDWDEFSQLAGEELYVSVDDCRREWETLDPDGRIGIGAVFARAKLDTPEGHNAVLRAANNITPEQISACAAAINTYQFTDDALGVTHKACCPRFRLCGDRWYQFKAPRWSLAQVQDVNLSLVFELQPVLAATAAQFELEAGRLGDEEAKQKLIARAGLLRKLGTTLFTREGKQRALSSLSNFAHDRDLSRKLDANPTLLAFEDLVWDDRLNVAREGVPDDYITKSTGYPFPTVPPSPEEDLALDAFLDNIHCDPAILHYVLATMRLLINGNNPRMRHQLFLLTGNGGGGKTALLTVLGEMLGGILREDSYAYKLPVAAICSRRGAHTAADEVMLRINGTRFVMVAEPSGSNMESLNDSLVNELTGGEGITARALYGQPITFVPQCYFFIAANDCLNLDGANSGLARRFRCIRHCSRFIREGDGIADPKRRIFLQDDACYERAKALAPKLMHRILFGQWITEMPPAVRNWSSAYLGERNIVQTFVEETLVQADPACFGVDMVQLKARFKDYATSNGDESAVKRTDLKNKLTNFLGECLPAKMFKDGRRAKSVFVGWTFRSNDDAGAFAVDDPPVASTPVPLPGKSDGERY